MGRGENHPLGWRAMIQAIVRGVKPKNTAKWLEAELGCSPRQSWRIVQEGRVAHHLRARLLSLVDEAIASNEEHLRQLRRELKDLEGGRSPRATTPEYPLERVAGAASEALPGLVERATEPFVKDE